MKKIILLTCLLSISAMLAQAQEKIVKYCEVNTQDVGFTGNKLKVELVTGKVDSLFSPRKINMKSDMDKVESMTTIPDILNYMGSLGWSMVNVIAITNRKYFYFKKEFTAAELNTKN